MEIARNDWKTLQRPKWKYWKMSFDRSRQNEGPLTNSQLLKADALKEEAARHKCDAMLLQVETQWRSERSSLEEQLKEKSASAQRLKNEIEQQQASWYDQKEAFQKDIQKEQETNEILQQQINELDKSLSDASQEIASIRQESQTKEMELQAMVEAETMKRVNLQKNMDLLFEEHDLLLSQNESTTISYEESMQIASAAVAAAEARDVEAQEALQKAQSEIVKFQGKLQESKRTISQLHDEKSAIALELQQEKSRLLELQRQERDVFEKEKAQAAIAASTIEAATRENDYALRQQIAKLQGEIKLLQSEKLAQEKAAEAAAVAAQTVFEKIQEAEQKQDGDGTRAGLWKTIKGKFRRSENNKKKV